MPTQDECRAGILQEWQKRKPTRRRSTQAERQMFIVWLGQNRPDLLDFRCRDKWQNVYEWLTQDDDDDDRRT
jgi:hypothetical protein